MAVKGVFFIVHCYAVTSEKPKCNEKYNAKNACKVLIYIIKNKKINL